MTTGFLIAASRWLLCDFLADQLHQRPFADSLSPLYCALLGAGSLALMAVDAAIRRCTAVAITAAGDKRCLSGRLQPQFGMDGFRYELTAKAKFRISRSTYRASSQPHSRLRDVRCLPNLRHRCMKLAPNLYQIGSDRLVVSR